MNTPTSTCTSGYLRTTQEHRGALRSPRKPAFALRKRVLHIHNRSIEERPGSSRKVKAIETAKPAEDVGRDTLSRYDMQFQAAAYAALQILEGKGVDCVYCDFHDDFVVRRVVAGITTYHFFQVKTKNKLNHQWSLGEIFALKKVGQKNDGESLKKVRESFAGKLLLHGIVFDAACIEATLLSNVYFHDDVVQAVDELRGKVPKCKAAKFLSDNFSAIFSITPELPGEKIEELLGKLTLKPSVGYIDKDRGTFAGAARSAIYEYSEIDLTHYETKELANGLVDLVYRKSKMPLEGVAPMDIASRIGVGLNDLLEVLSISRSAYEALLKGAEPKALKQASAIQRWLRGAGAGEEMIEYASMQKVNWDLWLRTARHNYSPLDLGSLLDQIDKLYLQWVQSGEGFQCLNQLLEDFSKVSFLAKFGGLNRELLFGAIGSVVVRVYSK